MSPASCLVVLLRRMCMIRNDSCAKNFLVTQEREASLQVNDAVLYITNLPSIPRSLFKTQNEFS